VLPILNGNLNVPESGQKVKEQNTCQLLSQRRIELNAKWRLIIKSSTHYLTVDLP